jgi:hypothetical protein
MTYLSKAERERARWMTAAEAIIHIQKAESCGRDEAWVQLRKAIADGEVAVRWADASLEPSNTRPGHSVEQDDVPPASKQFWAVAWFRSSGRGRILDDPALRPRSVRYKLIKTGDLEFRPLLVFREAVDASRILMGLWDLMKYSKCDPTLDIWTEHESGRVTALVRNSHGQRYVPLLGRHLRVPLVRTQYPLRW